MRFRIAFLVVLLLSLCTPAHAEGGTMSAGDVHVTIDVGPIIFDGEGCTDVPWTVTYLKPADDSIKVSWTLHQRGSIDDSSDYTTLTSLDPDSGTVSGTMCLLSWDHNPDAGPYVLSGYLSQGLSAPPVASIPPVEIPARVSPSRFTRFSVHAETGGMAVMLGRALARTSTGYSVAAGGHVHLDVRRHGVWLPVFILGPSKPGTRGRFEVGLFDDVHRGEKVRARLVDCGWCTETSVKTRVRR